MKIWLQKTHLGKCNGLCSMRVSWLYIIQVNVTYESPFQKMHSAVWRWSKFWKGKTVCFSRPLVYKCKEKNFIEIFNYFSKSADCQNWMCQKQPVIKTKQVILCFRNILLSPLAQVSVITHWTSWSSGPYWGLPCRSNTVSHTEDRKTDRPSIDGKKFLLMSSSTLD